jgi:hypothetical protein
MGFVLVQHLDSTDVGALSEVLTRATAMPVVDVRVEPTLEPNRVRRAGGTPRDD